MDGEPEKLYDREMPQRWWCTEQKFMEAKKMNSLAWQ